MRAHEGRARSIFQEIGTVRWHIQAFAVTTKRGAMITLSPNSDVLPSVVHIDEVFVPISSRRRGIASEALGALCRTADKYHFELEGGPVGWSDCEWSAKFVEWLQGFGFRRDPQPPPAAKHDPRVFNIRRRPHRTC